MTVPSKSTESRWRIAGIALAAGILLLAGAALFAVVSLFRSFSSLAEPSATTTASAASTTSTTSVAATSATSTAPSSGVVAAAVAPASSSGHRVLLPTDPDPANPNARAAPAANYGDAFESWDGKPSEVRTVVTVDGIRLGVGRTAKVHDEQKVASVLTELGHELAKLDHGRTDSYESRARDYGPVLDKYGARLAADMDGDFAFHAGQWVLFHPATASGAAAPAGSVAP